MNIAHKRLAVLCIGIALCAGSARAQEWAARPAAGTPFDARITMAGLTRLAIPAGAVPRTDLPDGLFRKARSFRYQRDGRHDRWQSPDETELRRSGDCEDKALWLFARMRQSGYRNLELFLGRYCSIESRLHMWIHYTDAAGHVWVVDPAKQRRIWKKQAFSQELYHPLFAFDGTQTWIYGDADPALSA